MDIKISKKHFVKQKIYNQYLKRGRILKRGIAICNYCGRVARADYVSCENMLVVLVKCCYDMRCGCFVLEKLDSSTVNLDVTPNRSKTMLQSGDMPRYFKKHIAKIPCNIYVPISDTCNSSCLICYEQNSQHKSKVICTIDTSYILQKLKGIKSKKICLYGYEPTMRRDLCKIIALVKKTGNTPVIATNGLRLSDRAYVNDLHKAGIHEVYLSFDGFIAEMYTRFRGALHERTMKLQALDNLGKENIRTTLNTVVIHSINTCDVENIINYCLPKMHIAGIVFLSLYMPGVSDDSGLDYRHMISREDFLDILAKSTGLSKSYFEIFYQLKKDAKMILNRMNPYNNDVLYTIDFFLKRTEKGFAPFLSLHELRFIQSILHERKWQNLFCIKVIIKCIKEVCLLFLNFRRKRSLYLRLSWRPNIDLPENTDITYYPWMIPITDIVD
jgi:molybdenum cofactor biosynthesis enzyme MoaA